MIMRINNSCVQGRRLATTVGALGAALLTSAASAIVIDNFNDVADPNPWPLLIDIESSQTVTEIGLDPANVIGGVRTTTLDVGTILTPGLDVMTASIFPIGEGGVLDYSSTVGAAGALNLTYDADGAGLGADLSDEIGIRIHIELFDLSNGEPLDIMLTLMDDEGNIFTNSVLLDTPGTQTALLDLGDLGGGEFDLTAVDSVSLDFDGALGTDFRISFIETFVPAPSGLALLGIALGASRRRRRR